MNTNQGAFVLGVIVAGIFGYEHAHAADPPSAAAQRAGAMLERAQTPKALLQATLDVVRSNDEAVVKTLVERMGREDYLAAFPAIQPTNRSENTIAMAMILEQIAALDSRAAEDVLCGLSESDAFSGGMKGGDAGRHQRAVLLIEAMGELHSPTEKTLRVLERALSRSLDYSEIHALRALVNIGTEATVNAIRRSLFQGFDWDKRTLVYITEMARRRDRLPVFQFILKLSQDAPTHSMRAAVLENLTARTSTPDDPGDEPITFRSYDALQPNQGTKFLAELDALATSRFDEKSLQLIDTLERTLKIAVRD